MRASNVGRAAFLCTALGLGGGDPGKTEKRLEQARAAGVGPAAPPSGRRGAAVRGGAAAGPSTPGRFPGEPARRPKPELGAPVRAKVGGGQPARGRGPRGAREPRGREFRRSGRAVLGGDRPPLPPLTVPGGPRALSAPDPPPPPPLPPPVLARGSRTGAGGAEGSPTCWPRGGGERGHLPPRAGPGQRDPRLLSGAVFGTRGGLGSLRRPLWGS